MSTIHFPDFFILETSDVIDSFMEPYNPNRKYGDYDKLFIKRLLSNICQAWICQDEYKLRVDLIMGRFSDPDLIYSDETYNPRLAMKNAYNLSHAMFERINLQQAFINGIFPYMFYDLTPGMAAIFKHQPQLRNYQGVYKNYAC